MLAAGEVVERPSSVVKELVENSLDAGATQIDIVIEQGGIRKIQVSDNGIGILKEDIRNAFLPHATSKLQNIDDLDSLATLGFRGEALASIASVSEVTLISASKSQGTAAKITLSGGNVTYEGEDSRKEGTIITVENLFFNTPARLKFLKKPSSEARQVLDTVRMLTLANPSAAISLSDENGVLLSSEGGTLADAICAVYGAKTAVKLREICTENAGSINVGGYISACDFTKSNRTYQTIIVNGRVVQDATVQTAAEKAYGDYLMKRAYPMFVLDIIMPFADVDSNVHPAKTEVRFVDKQKVFGAVYHAVLDTIKKSVSDITYGFDVAKDNKPQQAENFALENGYASSDAADLSAENVQNTYAVLPKNNSLQNPHSSNTYAPAAVIQPRIDTQSLYHGKTAPKNTSGNMPLISALTENSNGILKETPFNFGSFADANDIGGKNGDQTETVSVFDGRIIGQAFATYLLVERDEKLYIIDQHAAHERILYDKLKEKFDAKYSQPLLIPYRLTLTADEEEYLECILPQLNEMGFEIENTGFSRLVTAVPEPIASVSFQKVIGELFSNMLGDCKITLAGLLKESICQQACKAAIKGGETLSREQIERVIKNYLDENGNLPSKCPHGRPAVVVLEKRDLEKMFKRIV